MSSGESASTGQSGEGAANGATLKAHDSLRRLILEGDLPAGAVFSQLSIAKRLSVGRTPLREALKLLEREGLVVQDGPHRLVRVSSLSMTDLDDLYSLRVVGEALAAWLTVPILRSGDLDSMERSLESKTDEGHRLFHALLRRGAGERMNEHLERLFEHAARYQRAFMRVSAEQSELKFAEHAAILESCRSRDRERARDLLVDHLADTAERLMMAERHAPFMLPSAVAMAKGLSEPSR